MFSMLLNPLSKGLLIVASLAILATIITTNLYLSKRDELTSLESKYTQLKQDYKECSEGKEKLRISAEQDDTIVLNKQIKIDTLTKEKDDLFVQLNKIPKKTCPTIPTSTIDGKQNEIQYVDIDAPFDDEYKRVFQQLDKRNPDITP